MKNREDNYKKKNPFTVPEGYFDELTERIVRRMEQKSASNKPGIVQLFKPYMGLAAISLLAFLLIRLLFAGENQADATHPLNGEAIAEDVFDSHFNPTNEEIIEYLSTEVDNYEFLYAGNY